MPLATGPFDNVTPATMPELQTMPIWAIDADTSGPWDQGVENYVTTGVYHFTQIGVPGEELMGLRLSDAEWHAVL